MLAAAGPVFASDYFNGFETDLDGSEAIGGPFNPERVPSGTNNIPSADGDWHARAASPNAVGNWGGYNDVDGCAATACGAGALFPPDGYHTALDIYLDVEGGFLNDTRFNVISAVNRPDGNHRRDFTFNCGFYDDATGPGPGTVRFICSASNHADSSNSFPKNPEKDPVAVTTDTGWFTFQHFFYDDGTGVLAVDLSIIDGGGNVINTWTVSDPSDIIDDTVAGNRYGWIAFIALDVLAFDNALRMNGPPAPAEPSVSKVAACVDELGAPVDLFAIPVGEDITCGFAITVEAGALADVAAVVVKDLVSAGMNVVDSPEASAGDAVVETRRGKRQRGSTPIRWTIDPWTGENEETLAFFTVTNQHPAGRRRHSRQCAEVNLGFGPIAAFLDEVNEIIEIVKGEPIIGTTAAAEGEECPEQE